MPRRIPYPLAVAIGAIEESRVRAFGGLPLVTRGTVDIFRCDWSLDSRVAIRDLDYTITPLAAGLERTLGAMRS